jgi:hypothetical protein
MNQNVKIRTNENSSVSFERAPSSETMSVRVLLQRQSLLGFSQLHRRVSVRMASAEAFHLPGTGGCDSVLTINQWPNLSTKGPVVETSFLANNLDRVKVLDSSWHMPSAKRDAVAEFTAKRIPGFFLASLFRNGFRQTNWLFVGARFFDIEAVSDRTTALPHMLPSVESFEAAASMCQ